MKHHKKHHIYHTTPRPTVEHRSHAQIAYDLVYSRPAITPAPINNNDPDNDGDNDSSDTDNDSQ